MTIDSSPSPEREELLDEPTDPGMPLVAQRRAAGALLVAGSAIFWLAEFIAAAAWTDPPYSYTYHYISDLGVRGPSTAFDQYMYSPLAWVMNTGFFLFGIVLFAGVAMLRGLEGRRWRVLAPAAVVAIGGIALAFFHGSSAAMDNGTIAFHGLGAFGSIVSGNVLAILLGRRHRLLGASRTSGRAMIALGIFGLVSTAAFLVVGGSGATVLIGLVERCGVYPCLIGFVCAGASILKRHPLDRIST